MPQKSKSLLITSVLAIVVVAVIALVFVYRQTARRLHNVHQHQIENMSVSNPDANTPALTLDRIIASAYTWQPAFTSWLAKPAPDFTVTDITGRQHTLSSYLGKDVLVIFWATWCGPCRMEIPHLIALRNIVSTNDLVMLALSNENPDLVKKFAAAQKINYIISATDTRKLPEPFNQANIIPAAFFIDKKGQIKLATEGTLSLGEIKQILKAQ